MKSRDAIARIRVSRFSRDVSRVRRISAGEKRLKISSVVSGSSQNYSYQLAKVCTCTMTLTEVQYGSSAGMFFSSESLKMPFLKTSFESEAPIADHSRHESMLTL